MRSTSRVGNGSSGRPPASHDSHREGLAAIYARHQLLSDAWTADVEALERAIGRFKIDSKGANDCDVAFFEIVGDAYLHCNVTHRHATKTVTGWSGPGHVPGGVVHNRRFGDLSRNDVIRHIREMVFAAPV